MPNSYPIQTPNQSELKAEVLRHVEQLQKYIIFSDVYFDDDLIDGQIKSFLQEISQIQHAFDNGNADDYLRNTINIDDSLLNACILLDDLQATLYQLQEVLQDETLQNIEQAIDDLQSLQAEYNAFQTEQQANQNINNNNGLLNSEQQTEQQSEPSLIPLYSVLRNGEPIYITGSIQTAHKENIALDIMHHLQAVSDDEFTLQVVQWIDDTATSTYTDTWDNETELNSKGVF